jgi:hypothetical protein
VYLNRSATINVYGIDCQKKITLKTIISHVCTCFEKFLGRPLLLMEHKRTWLKYVSINLLSGTTRHQHYMLNVGSFFLFDGEGRVHFHFFRETNKAAHEIAGPYLLTRLLVASLINEPVMFSLNLS